MRVALWRWALAFCMLTILVFSLMPPSPSLPSTGWDKSNHALGFMALAFLSHWAWPGRTAAALAGLLAYGALIEVLQSLTPNRQAEFADLFADAVGLAIGAVTAWLVAHWMHRRSARSS